METKGIALSMIALTVALSISAQTNKVAKFTSTTMPTGLTQSSIFDNGTNVGIGLTTPISTLHLLAPSLGTTTLTLQRSNANGYGSVLNFLETNPPTLPTSYLGVIGFQAKVSGTTYTGASIVPYAMNAWTSSNQNTRIVFNTTNGTTLSEKMTILNDGKVGIGTSAPTARLNVKEDATNVSAGIFETGATDVNNSGVVAGVKGISANTQTIPNYQTYGVYGLSTQTAYSGTNSGYNTGVYGKASGGTNNVGGEFDATTTSTGWCFGISVTASGPHPTGGQFDATVTGTGASTAGISTSGTAVGAGKTAYGITASAIAVNGATGWAGYFSGNVYTTGTYQSSDAKLKKNIKLLPSSIDKINLLKPSTYNYRVDEFKEMNLPEENQIGLIAQDVEKVFPELVKEVSAEDHFDKQGNKMGTTPAFKVINYTALIPVLISGIQEQQKSITEQRAMLEAQATEIEDLKNKLTTGINNQDHSSSEIKLYQNEPNPFDQEAIIKYNLPENVTNAYVAVYDLAGKELEKFLLTEKGEASVKITSDKLSAGIYIYSIIADNKLIDSKRMVLTSK
jgi:hypothetical protein